MWWLFEYSEFGYRFLAAFPTHGPFFIPESLGFAVGSFLTLLDATKSSILVGPVSAPGGFDPKSTIFIVNHALYSPNLTRRVPARPQYREPSADAFSLCFGHQKPSTEVMLPRHP